MSTRVHLASFCEQDVETTPIPCAFQEAPRDMYDALLLVQSCHSELPVDAQPGKDGCSCYRCELAFAEKPSIRAANRRADSRTRNITMRCMMGKIHTQTRSIARLSGDSSLAILYNMNEMS